MKRIVVYKMIILIGALLLATGLKAQKPAIDLISTHQQYKHPESIVDTGYAVNPLIREPLLIQAPPSQNEKLTEESEKKKRRQIGPSLDSLFQKKETERKSPEKAPVKTSLFNRKYIPMKIFIFII
ncbi:MAG: hypothetical protein U9R60_01135, partial [Bacteroidota bacterium]|nr:hypothetical protein [Bacteroidota bacterium]